MTWNSEQQRPGKSTCGGPGGPWWLAAFTDTYGPLLNSSLKCRFFSSTFRLAVFRGAPGFNYSDIMRGHEEDEDYLHPGDLGHHIMADLAVWLFQQTAIDLLIRPWSDEEEQMLEEGLPKPMYKGENQGQLRLNNISM